MDKDLFQVLLVLAFILFGLLGGRKKKKPPVPGGQTSGRTPAQPRPARDLPGQARRQVSLEELGRMLEAAQRPPTPTTPRRRPPRFEQTDAPETSTWMEGLERSAESHETTQWEAGLARAAKARETSEWEAGLERAPITLETLEGAGDESHRRFHQRYDLSSPATLDAQPEQPDGAALRRAIVWSEILAPPVSLRG
jgi:hypothetical protein